MGSKRVMCALSSEGPGSLVSFEELPEAGKTRPVIDRSYPLEQTAEAHRYVEEGGKMGNVVITVEHNSKT